MLTAKEEIDQAQVQARVARVRRKPTVESTTPSEIVACGHCGTVYTGNHTCDEEGTE
jgi:hypothetical protein